MNKKNILIIKSFLVFFLTLFFLSCEDFIDLKPLDQIAQENYWKSSSDLKNYMVQFYPNFFPHTSMIVNLAIDSDEMIHGGSPSVFLNGERTTRTGTWRGEWTQIRNLNIFFENYQKCEDEFSSYQHYVGEAHFFRAWFYFELLKMYGDLPWYDEVIELDDDEKLMMPRESRAKIIDNILLDLDKATLYLNARKDVGNCVINKEVSLAFQTRVALFEGSWQKYHAGSVFATPDTDPNKYFRKCIEASNELLTGDYYTGIYGTGSPDIDYFKMFGLVNMGDINEILLYKSFNMAEGYRNTVEGYLSYNPDQKSATWDLVSSYLGKNGKPFDYLELSESKKGNDFLTQIAENCDPRLKSTIYIPGDYKGVAVDLIFEKPAIDAGVLQLVPTGFQIKKTTDPNSVGAGQSWEVGSETGLIIFRFGEVLLNYAEAKYELDNTVAYEQLNLLRERAGMPDFTVNKQDEDPNLINYGYPISDELYEIRRERRVELALEGMRDEDLNRWAAHSIFKGKRPKGYPLNKSEFPEYTRSVDENGLIDFYKNQLPNGYQFKENRDYLYSIPQEELTLNPNLVQNPGW
ncbi:MAG: RagB/SusD family nutrient uptake outer membrane protein [Fermentimonas sp.]|nr:RagB/SusD family nutrient uptake outer membrane protein [Fermentimonas sp.]